MALKKNPSGDGPHAAPVAQGFGMPQALVILGFLTAAVVLRLVAQTSVQDTVVLLTVAGGVSIPVMLAAGSHSRSRRQTVRRLLDAVLTPGSGN
ncbi:hypothetical protein ACGFOM_38270 [Streptomyces sp. NPDC048594]|uniref:hypothetical protein n=1 Tax=Streptomyces sp. NPDC048594 TaxID=3365575 RepID=UPI00370FC087